MEQTNVDDCGCGLPLSFAGPASELAENQLKGVSVVTKLEFIFRRGLPKT